MGKRALLLVVGIAAAGCSQKLETGYKPNRLGMSIAQRRGLYADPYSAEKQAAQQDRQEEMKARRPTNY